jgi:hypothetical protein
MAALRVAQILTKLQELWVKRVIWIVDPKFIIRDANLDVIIRDANLDVIIRDAIFDDIRGDIFDDIRSAIRDG